MYRAVIAAMACVLLVSCSRDTLQTFPGYIEAEYTRVAAPFAGRLGKLSVERGANIKAGDLLFVLEAENEKASLTEAQARVQRNLAQAADLAKGKRRDEINVLKAQLAAAQASHALGLNDLRRQRELARAGFVSGASLEAVQTRVQAEAAKVGELEAQLRVAQLAAREDARAVASADVTVAQAQLVQSQWRLDQRSVSSPVAARVDDTVYREGEWVQAGSPIVSLREEGAIKVRFFVPQAMLSQVPVGKKLQIACDGCQSFAAEVSYVAQNAEFTPPVIYSKENRAKLVFLVEAVPLNAQVLSPGQPVDIMLDTAP